MTFFYIKHAPNGDVTGWEERRKERKNYNTAATSAANGKRYFTPVPLQNVTRPSPSSTQALSGPVIVTSPASLTWSLVDRGFQELRNIKIRAVQALMNQKFAEGRLYNGNTFQIRKVDQDNLRTIKIMLNGGGAAGNDPHDGGWRNINNVKVAMNDSQMEALCDDIFTYCATLLRNNTAHKDAINALPDNAATINAYDITTGWPSNV